MAEDNPSPAPFTPPTTEEDRLSCLRLIRSRRVGPATWRRLCAAHGSAEAALAALPGIARAAGERDYAPCSEQAARAEIAAGRAAGAFLVVQGDPGYPALLHDLPDSPPVLWALGDAALLDRTGVALVGARNASSLGLRMARRLALDLGSAGLVVISGLARGIDAAAHGAAIETGTIAVIAGGIDSVYPPENAALSARIADAGLLLTEAPVGQQPQARHFPARNRLIAALARGVVVVEAAPRSGSLITAELALGLGREVMAVPGHPLDARAGGCNALIRDGAALIRGGEDALQQLRANGIATPRQDATDPARQAVSSPARPIGAPIGTAVAPPLETATARPDAPHAAMPRQSGRDRDGSTAGAPRSDPDPDATPAVPEMPRTRRVTATHPAPVPELQLQAGPVARRGARPEIQPAAPPESPAPPPPGSVSGSPSAQLPKAGAGPAPRDPVSPDPATRNAPHSVAGPTGPAGSHRLSHPVSGPRHTAPTGRHEPVMSDAEPDAEPDADVIVEGASPLAGPRRRDQATASPRPSRHRQPDIPQGQTTPHRCRASDQPPRHMAPAPAVSAPAGPPRQAVPPAPDISARLPDGVAAQARLHRMILDRLAAAPVPEDMLIRDLARPAAEVARSLVTLELDGRVQRHPGGLLSRPD